eukprot:TRINITY_DN5551_c0_g1_i1.p1 TRINITY_DN5551_c0_g1~~TRINITY_DN5551_c0_g1_i1.p1  ORF type:complete len:577 (+),score=127.99 TRINITY_DN5551_c0_g1_i1:62-1732(+)
MKLSEMNPADNALHRYFKDVAMEFEGREVWKKFSETHFSFEIEGDEEKVFKYFKYVKNKVQIFRDYGDLLQTERSNDPETYAAPEGQVELEIRPERVEGVKIPRPRCNVYVPMLTPPKEFEGSYTHRVPTDYELQILTQVAMAGDKLKDLAPTLETDPDISKEADRTAYKPFETTVVIKGMDGSDLAVKMWTPPTYPDVMRKCEFCARRRAEMARCAGCKIAYYCSPEHQKLDWKQGHKKSCALKAKTAQLSPDEEPFTTVGTVPWARPTPSLEEFHGGNVAPYESQQYTRPVWEDVDPPKYPSKQTSLLSSWEGLYNAMQLTTTSPHAVALSDVMTVYHIMTQVVTAWRGKECVTVHVVDACLEPVVLHTFGVLSALIPDMPKLKILFAGRRIAKDMHYKVFSWREDNWEAVEGEPTGVIGDIWRGRGDDRVVTRFYADDYSAFIKKCDSAVTACDLVLLLNCPNTRHSFFHSTTHACALHIQNGIPVVFAAYSRYAAEQITSAFSEVAQKEGKPLATSPLELALNPFRSPYKEATEVPIPCFANAYIGGWVPVK